MSLQYCVIVMSKVCINTGYIVRNTKLNSYDTLYCKSLAYYACKLGVQKYTNCAIG